MARIIENPEGRRMIRLSPDDVINVVQAYQRRLLGAERQSATSGGGLASQELRRHLAHQHVYLPEDI
jgi:hypothetical protein